MYKLKELNLTDILFLLFKRKSIFILLSCLILIFGGVRFSDINNLYQISLENNIDILQTLDQWNYYNVSAEYLYDSPLKFLLINIIPANKLLITCLFLAINLLPFIFFLKENYYKNLFLISIFIFSPLIKILSLNIGSGDGVMIYLVLLVFLFKKNVPIVICFFFMGLWHPQQSFFIFFSYFIGSYCLTDQIDNKRFILCSFSIFLSFLIYIFFKQYFLPDFVGRTDILIENFVLIFERNINYLFFILLPFVFWFYIFFTIRIKYKFIFYTWILLLITLSLVVLDSSRILMITILPVIYFAIKSKLSKPKTNVYNYLIFFTIIINIISPTISWSGIDWILYYDLLNDMCNHFKICMQ